METVAVPIAIRTERYALSVSDAFLCQWSMDMTAGCDGQRGGGALEQWIPYLPLLPRQRQEAHHLQGRENSKTDDGACVC